MDYEYIKFFSQFDDFLINITSREYDINLFYLAYIEAGKHSDMTVIPASLRIFKTAIIYNTRTISFGTKVTRRLNNECYNLFGLDIVFSQRNCKELCIPPSVIFLHISYTNINKIPSTIKYFTIDTVIDPFTIDVELEYLCLHELWSNKLIATKKIKFLSVSCVVCLNRLHNVLPYVEYIIIRRNSRICDLRFQRYYHNYHCTSYSLNRLKCVFAEKENIINTSVLMKYPMYTFKELNKCINVDLDIANLFE
jgi:hypothetical protein